MLPYYIENSVQQRVLRESGIERRLPCERGAIELNGKRIALLAEDGYQVFEVLANIATGK